MNQLNTEIVNTPQQALGEVLNTNRAALASAITERHYQLNPDLLVRFGVRGRVKCLQDAEYHLSYLAVAVSAGSPSLFADYAAWAKVMLHARGVTVEDLARNFEVLRTVVEDQLHAQQLASLQLDGEPAAAPGATTERGAATEADTAAETSSAAKTSSIAEPVSAAGMATVLNQYVDAALRRLPLTSSELATEIGEAAPHAGLAREFIDALLRGDRATASRLVLAAVEGGVPVRDIYLHVFQASQREIGRLWQLNQVTVAQEHYCTASTQLIMAQLYPHIFQGRKNGRRILSTSIAGDLHEIGVRIITDFFEMEGWDSYYLGANCPTPSVLQALSDQKPDLLAVSATMTYHVRDVQELIGAIRRSPEFASLRILVGGYPFNVEPELWKRIGADACATDAATAVATAEALFATSP